MARALALARLGRFWAKPNPHVGCVLVRDGRVIGEGFTQPAGDAHAEVVALRAAGDARGATAYVTLEPCAHHGRTPPCAEALIASGVRRVVVAIEDPDPRVSGAGCEQLRQSGVLVDVGVCAEAAAEELRGFLLRQSRGWGRVRLKSAMSLDGRMAMASGESQWITGAEARADVHRLRAESGFIVTGVGTVLADDCALTVRPECFTDDPEVQQRATRVPPTRVVLDSQGRMQPNARILDDSAPSWVFSSVPVDHVDLQTRCVEASPQGLALQPIFTALGEAGANEILVEAGPRLSTALLQGGWIDEWVIYQSPSILGTSAQSAVQLRFETLAESMRLEYASLDQIGQDVRLVLRPTR